jgi:hypothetical protein
MTLLRTDSVHELRHFWDAPSPIRNRLQVVMRIERMGFWRRLFLQEKQQRPLIPFSLCKFQDEWRLWPGDPDERRGALRPSDYVDQTNLRWDLTAGLLVLPKV